MRPAYHMLGLDWKNSVKKSLYLHYKQSEMFIKLFITLEFRELIELIELLLNLDLYLRTQARGSRYRRSQS